MVISKSLPVIYESCLSNLFVVNFNSFPAPIFLVRFILFEIKFNSSFEKITPLVLSFSKLSLFITAFPTATISFLFFKLWEFILLSLEKIILLFSIPFIFNSKIFVAWILPLFTKLPSFFKFLFLMVISLTPSTFPLFVIVSPINVIFNAWTSELFFNIPLFTTILFVAINLSVFSNLPVSIFIFFAINSLLFLISFEFITISSLDWIFPLFIKFLFWLIFILPTDKILPLFLKSVTFKSFFPVEYRCPIFTKYFAVIELTAFATILLLFFRLFVVIFILFPISSLFSISSEFIVISLLDWIFLLFIKFLFWLIFILPTDKILPLFLKSVTFKSFFPVEYIIPLFTRFLAVISILAVVAIFVLLFNLSVTIFKFFAVSSLFSILLLFKLIFLSE